MIEVSLETRKKLSESLKKKWASGTRKKNPDEMYERTSVIMKNLYATGVRKPHLTREDCMKGLANRDPEKLKAALRANAIKRIGTKGVGRNAASTENSCAKYWELKHPASGKVLEGMNLAHMIREESKFFNINPEDKIAVRKLLSGLAQLFKLKPDGELKNTSYKGWLIGDKMKREEHIERLRRKQ